MFRICSTNGAQGVDQLPKYLFLNTQFTKNAIWAVPGPTLAKEDWSMVRFRICGGDDHGIQYHNDHETMGNNELNALCCMSSEEGMDFQ